MKTLHILIFIICSTAEISFGDVFQLKSQGRQPGKDLTIKKSGVPTYNLVKKGQKIKDIPRLDIGEEKQIEAAQLTPQQKQPIKAVQLSPLQKQKSPEIFRIDSLIKKGITHTGPAKEIVKINPQFQAPAVKPLKEIPDPKITEREPSQKKLIPFSSAEEKLLQALIFLEIHKAYHMAIGIFSELIAESPEMKTESAYHLALTAWGLGLTSEFRYQMNKVLKDPQQNWQKKATSNFAHNGIEGDLDLVPIVDPKIDEFETELTKADRYQLNRAHYYMNKANLTQAQMALDEIQPDSSLYPEAQFMKGVLLYRSGQVDESQKQLQSALKIYEQKAPDSELKSVTALTLARIYFQVGKYKEAFDLYLKVNKNNPLWTQAMVEQAWAQILTEDYEGAAGNMYTLHTDFFKNTFTPESYIVRTVGYLNLCQYGDGMKVLYSFKKKYAPVLKQLEDYKKTAKQASNYYDTIRTFFQNPQNKTIDGLNRNFVYELARHPSFMNEQKQINHYEDQIQKWNQLSLDLVQRERQLLAQQTEAEKKLEELKRQKNKPSPLEIKSAEDKVTSLRIQYQIAKRARNSIKDVRTAALTRLEQDKEVYKKKAAEALKARFETIQTTLSKTLDQSDILSYEIYSGAGEHLRYQMAGGDISEKDRIELKVQDGKSLKWEFKGEVWEDELGHYRSSLKNVCAKENDEK
ncbi:MAG: hypothetical protein BroJett040_23390 [Oligoflexia bacterium]|nr:MAG: hypothetical protein BroJett040_23390 [Oligoflexia bacterium]